MKRERKCLKCFNSAAIALLILCVSILNIETPEAIAAEKIAANKVVTTIDSSETVDSTRKELGEPARDENADEAMAQDQIAAITEQAKSPAPQTTTTDSGKTDSGGHTLLYAGIGVGAVAVAAGVAAAVSGGGSSSSESVAEPTPTLAPVGHDIGGKSWKGFLALVDGFKENVTATVSQNGASIVITTSSTQQYGKKFVGQISRDGKLLVYDQTTGEDWTTYQVSTRWNSIDIYDLVHDNKDLDRLYLRRTTLD